MSLKVVAFDKDSKDRVKEAKMVEAVEETDVLEASVKRRLQRMKEVYLHRLARGKPSQLGVGPGQLAEATRKLQPKRLQLKRLPLNRLQLKRLPLKRLQLKRLQLKMLQLRRLQPKRQQWIRLQRTRLQK